MSGVNLNDPRSATQRGFGRLWSPSGERRTDMVTLRVDGVEFVGGVHPALHGLLELVLAECVRRGYKLKTSPTQNWGFAWRAIRGTEDWDNPVPTNHSAGTAIDINSATNWLGRTDGGDIPRRMADLFNEYGFRWGGDYSGREDPMHFEFMGTRDDARRLTKKARRELQEDEMTEAQKAELKELILFKNGVEGYFKDPEFDPAGKPLSFRQGFRLARMAAAGAKAEGDVTP